MSSRLSALWWTQKSRAQQQYLELRFENGDAEVGLGLKVLRLLRQLFEHRDQVPNVGTFARNSERLAF
jgi:hypothetical protein